MLRRLAVRSPDLVVILSSSRRGFAAAPTRRTLATKSNVVEQAAVASAEAAPAAVVAEGDAAAAAGSGAKSALRRQLGIYGELSKARLSALVVASTSAGYFMAETPISWTSLAAVTVGTTLAACSANTWNQVSARVVKKER